MSHIRGGYVEARPQMSARCRGLARRKAFLMQEKCLVHKKVLNCVVSRCKLGLVCLTAQVSCQLSRCPSNRGKESAGHTPWLRFPSFSLLLPSIIIIPYNLHPPSFPSFASASRAAPGLISGFLPSLLEPPYFDGATAPPVPTKTSYTPDLPDPRGAPPQPQPSLNSTRERHHLRWPKSTTPRWTSPSLRPKPPTTTPPTATRRARQ